MKNRILFVVLAFFVATITFAQQNAKQAVEKDFPGLMKLYGDKLETCHAHYIFAIDISSSMLPFEETVKSKFLEFVNALPDGDEITLIKMASTDKTDYVNNCRSIKLNPEVRKNIKDIIYSQQFKFIRGGSSDGSDGYTMTKKVIEAINDVGSNDLVFVYFFTDFEYWTSHNKYNKSKENWDALKNKLANRRYYSMYKYGLELNFNDKSLRNEAIFKRELDQVFGPVEYQGVSTAAFLSQWFDQLQSNVLAMKLHSIVNTDWTKFNESVKLELSLSGDNVILETSSVDMPLAKGLQVELNGLGDNFIPNDIDDISTGEQETKIGRLVTLNKTWIPGYETIGGGDATVSIKSLSNYDDEIERLYELCEGITPPRPEIAGIDVPSFNVWNCHIPYIVVIIILVLIGLYILSTAYTIFFIRLNKSWSVVIERSVNGIPIPELSNIIKAPFELNSTKNKESNKEWTIFVYGKKYNPILFWKKSGYYIKIKSPSINTFEFIDPINRKSVKDTASTNREVFLSSYKKSKNIIIRIKRNENIYIIKLC